MERIRNKDVQNFETKYIEMIRKIAAECVVLLKNDGMLPLKKIEKLALYGSGARRTIKGGTGSGDVNVRHFVTVEEGLEKAGFQITSKDWLDGYEEVMKEARIEWIAERKEQARKSGIDPLLLLVGNVMPEPEYELPLDAEGDTAVYVLSRTSGEASDRQPVAGDINLSNTEIRDILALNRKYKRFILALNTGGMVDLEPVDEVKCIVLLSQLGTPIGDVFADLILGKAYPSGKLAMTWAPIQQYASTSGFGDMNDTRYKEGIYVGYRYFNSVREKPKFPFGYGLAYTDFNIKQTGFYADEEKISVTVSVSNMGEFKGKEVVQVYYSAPWGKLDKPYQELAAFAKTKELAPGETQELTLNFKTSSMSSFSEEQSAYMLEKGTYIIRVGNSSDNTEVCGAVRLCEDTVVCRTKNICPGWDFKDFVPERYSDAVPEDAAVINIQAEKIKQTTASYSNPPEKIQPGDKIDWRDVKSGKCTIDDFLAGLTADQLVRICMGNFEESGQSIVGNTSKLIAGGAGDTTEALADLHLDMLTMADGPAGIRVSREYEIVDGKVKSNDDILAAVVAEFMGEEQVKTAQEPVSKPEKDSVEKYYQYCVAIPIGTALAQSFNEEICEDCGDVVAEEMELFGINLWLAPAMNIQRSPLCGRNFEYYSEDPLLSGKMAAAVTRGVQKHAGRAVTVKHFMANNQETNRYFSNSIVSERAMREIYLKGFEICVKESMPGAIMSSYNLINGEHTCNSKDIMTYVLRDEWGYEGVVMTDWYVTVPIMENPSKGYPLASPAGCLKAGNNLIMPGTAGDKEDVLKALEDKTHSYNLTIEEVQENAKEILQLILKLKN